MGLREENEIDWGKICGKLNVEVWWGVCYIILFLFDFNLYFWSFLELN